MAWTVETLNETVDAELADLPADMRARFVRVAELIEAMGLPNVREPHVKHIRGPIWEIRLKGKSGIARALYVTVKAQRVVVVRAFVKKTQKTPVRKSNWLSRGPGSWRHDEAQAPARPVEQGPGLQSGVQCT